MKIEEVIVVEGRDDTNAIRRAVEADTIETHGFGIRQETWELIEKAYETRGIIVFTDPDFAGEQIRKRVLERFPDAKEAFIDREAARDGADIGVENAKPEDVIKALSKVQSKEAPAGDFVPYTREDMIEAGLFGGAGAGEKRRRVGAALGIGYGNCTAFLRKLNTYRVKREDFDGAVSGQDN